MISSLSKAIECIGKFGSQSNYMKKTFVLLLSYCLVFLSCSKTEKVDSKQAVIDNDSSSSKTIVLAGIEELNGASRILKCGDKYFWYATGPRIKMRWTSSPKSGTWSVGANVFSTQPGWWADYSPTNSAWAPDVVYDPASAEYRMYYCLSSLGSNTSAIGLAVNKTLDPNATNYNWVDKGIVISTHEEIDNFNALDPCPVQTSAGAWFLCFGSHLGGVKLIRLGPDGKRHPDYSTIWNLARKENTTQNACEAGSIYPGTKNGEVGFWLFVNWGTGTANGENSTYQVKMGWSTDVRGPYLDKDGINMYNGGGTLFMANQETFSKDGSTRIGRGHVGIIKGEMLDGSYPDWVSYNYWLHNPPTSDGKRFGLQRLETDSDGWPKAGTVF